MEFLLAGWHPVIGHGCVEGKDSWKELGIELEPENMANMFQHDGKHIWMSISFSIK